MTESSIKVFNIYIYMQVRHKCLLNFLEHVHIFFLNICISLHLLHFLNKIRKLFFDF